jgi:LysR family transcriptional regulator, cell division regulator
MLPSASDLNYLAAAAEAGNLTKAATQLGISQPSLSLAIQRLEREMETPLLERSSRGVRLTKAGQVVVKQARELTEMWAKIRANVMAANNDVAGVVTLGCHPAVAAYTLPKFLPELLHRFPDLEIRLRHDLSRRITQGVIDGEIDVGLVINPVHHPDLVMHQIAADEVGFWQAPNIGAEAQAICIADPELLQAQSLLRKAEKKGLRFHRIIATSQLELVAQLTAAGLGIGILPGRVAQSFVGGKIKGIPGMPTFADTLYVIYRAENRRRESLKAVVQAAREF